AGTENASAGCGLGGCGGWVTVGPYFAARDAYVSFCIQSRFWIHDSATRDDEVVVGSDVGERQADKQEKKE
ncbi:MAG: hypothetical protein L7V87_15230, partial [Verrucomicrobiales bacterium]|nr:hypothetical protein [Verrucomicrobiales bacterium]